MYNKNIKMFGFIIMDLCSFKYCMKLDNLEDMGLFLFHNKMPPQ
jgi:hypothetical protein